MHADFKLRTGFAQIVAMVVCATAASACTTAIETRDPVTGEVEVTYVDAPPLDIARYPHWTYEGREVYLVGDKWQYQQAGGRWVTYRREPDELMRRRPHQQMLVRP